MIELVEITTGLDKLDTVGDWPRLSLPLVPVAQNRNGQLKQRDSSGFHLRERNASGFHRQVSTSSTIGVNWPWLSLPLVPVAKTGTGS